MASNTSCTFSLSPHRHCYSDLVTATRLFFSRNRIISYNVRSPVFLSCLANGRVPYNNALISETVRLLGPPARFEASKLKVDFMGQETKYSRVVPRVYILSHCDFTANLTLTISNIINVDQLQGWYSKDDVVAEWKDMQGHMCLVVHCFLSGPNNIFVDIAAEFRYHIFSKELPLVLQAVMHGDSDLFRERPELSDAVVWVYFHSSSPKYNGIECWGPLKDASQKGKKMQGLLTANGKGMIQEQKWPIEPQNLFRSIVYFSSMSLLFVQLIYTTWMDH